MTLKATLGRLVTAIVDEAAVNPGFAARLEEALGLGPMKPTRSGAAAERPQRRGGRRAPAVLDPIEVVRAGEADLRAALAPLELTQLLDIVAEYGMDPGKLVMKWKDRDRVVDRIVEASLARATKGDAFRTG